MELIETPLQIKLADILRKKSARAGEFAIPFDATALPVDIRGTFPGYRSYTLEIGCGWGEFTRACAAQSPETLFIAIEKKLARVLSSSRTQKRAGLDNIRYLVLDIAWFFDGVFADAAFDAVTINFPDPWPKARHHKHRFVSPDFAEILTRITRPQSRLVFATDNYRYAREVTGVFESSAAWVNTVDPYLARGHIAARPVSFFEEVHRNEGAPIYFLEYERR